MRRTYASINSDGYIGAGASARVFFRPQVAFTITGLSYKGPSNVFMVGDAIIGNELMNPAPVQVPAEAFGLLFATPQLADKFKPDDFFSVPVDFPRMHPGFFMSLLVTNTSSRTERFDMTLFGFMGVP